MTSLMRGLSIALIVAGYGCSSHAVPPVSGGSGAPLGTTSLTPEAAVAAQRQIPVPELVSAGLARYVCEPHRGHGCMAVFLTPRGQALFHPGAQPPTPVPPTTTIIPEGCPASGCPPTPYVPKFGMTPADIRSAYNLPAHGGSGKTVAVYEPGDDPYLEYDLNVYRKTFGMKPCTIANGCLRIVDALGGNDYPYDAIDYGEHELDVDMVSANCQDCKILVVEAPVPNLTSAAALQEWLQIMAIGVKTAVTLHASAVSLSFAAGEGALPDAATAQFYAGEFNHPGIAITASSGDNGFDSLYPQIWSAAIPAAFPSVLAVGGTSLRPTIKFFSLREWKESAWISGGSGCASAYYGMLKPSWQKNTPCGNLRAYPDISFVADAEDGPMIYDRHPGVCVNGCWESGGGTSMSAPAIAAIAMLDSNPAFNVSTLYENEAAHPDRFWDITLGTNRAVNVPPCVPMTLCFAGPGFDGPTGIGTPNGPHGFDP